MSMFAPPQDPCPDCDCSLSTDWHSACHEMWEVSQQNAREYRRAQNMEHLAFLIKMILSQGFTLSEVVSIWNDVVEDK